VPAKQTLQLDAPLFACALPAGHWAQLEAPTLSEYVPIAHAVQVLAPVTRASALADAVANVPAGQFKQADDPEFVCTLPEGQAAQTTAASAEYIPAGQVTHLSIPLEDALGSGLLEKVPAAHAGQLVAAAKGW